MKPVVLYGVGTILIATGIGFILESGRRNGITQAKRDQANGTWSDASADYSGMGIVDNASVESSRDNSPDDAA